MQSLWLLGLVHWNTAERYEDAFAALRKQYKGKKGTSDEKE